MEWRRGGELQRARAEREVILAAGAMQSPQLLQLSGIGPAGAAARSTASPVVVDAPEVGENLQDHYQARIIVRLKEKLLAQQRRAQSAAAGADGRAVAVPPARPADGRRRPGRRLRRAPSTRADGRADMQFNVMPLSVDKPGEPLHDFSGFSASAAQCRPVSRGTVADPLGRPAGRCRASEPTT